MGGAIVTESDRRTIDHYLAQVRAGLRGLPREDVDDTVEEMRTHIYEETGERGDAEAVLADFGDAAMVASQLLERRVRPEGGQPVPQASLGRRYSAWATDVVVGLGPLLLVPTALTFAAWMLGLFAESSLAPVWIQLSEHVAHWWLTALGYTDLARPAPIPPVQWAIAAVLVAWALFYWLWLRRATASSVGMWMTGLTAVRVNDDRVVMRSRDVAQRPAPLGTGRGRWWILLAAVPVGCLCILLLIFYLWICIGPFLPPRILG